MTPEQWTKKSSRMRDKRAAEEEKLDDERESVEMPAAADLRPATPRDIKEGSIIYYPAKPGRDAYWKLIDEVLRPDDDFKAYCADDGCRYGLDGAYVRKS